MRILITATLFLMFAHSAAAETSYGNVKEAFAAYKEAIADGNTAKARTAARAAYVLGLERFGENHKNTAALALNYGRLLKGEDAQRQLRKTLQLYEGAYGTDAYNLVDPLMELAKAEAGFGDFSNSQQLYSRALTLVEQHDGAGSITAGMVNLEIGQVAMMAAASHHAVSYLEQSKLIFMNLEGPDAEYGLAQAKFWLGKYWLANRNEEKATEALLASLATFENATPNSSLTLANHAFLIEAYEKQGLREAATKHCQAIGQASPENSTQDYKPVYEVRPVYPRWAQLNNKEGYVIVALTVDKDGFVSDPHVIERDGHPSFEAAALEAVQRFRYVPRFENGKAVPTENVKYRFSFALAG